jgi:uncharacterized membrane protein
VGIAATILVIAGAAMAIGAWLVMPFAGLEIALLALAFHLVGVHDGDFERLEIGESEVRIESRDAHRVERFVGHRPWARVVFRERGARCTRGRADAGGVVARGRVRAGEGPRARGLSGRGW